MSPTGKPRLEERKPLPPCFVEEFSHNSIIFFYLPPINVSLVGLHHTETGDVKAVATLTDEQVAAVLGEEKGEANVQVNISWAHTHAYYTTPRFDNRVASAASIKSFLEPPPPRAGCSAVSIANDQFSCITLFFGSVA